VVPTRGAVVRADYKANVGIRILMTLTRANGQPVPFGAIVTIDGDKESHGFIVGDSGQVYLSGINSEDSFNAKWGEERDQQCNFKSPVTEKNKISGLSTAQQSCK
jgi:outer membrane usher protein